MEEKKSVGKLLTVREAAQRLRLSEAQVYRMVQIRELAGIKLGRSVRVFEQAIEDLLREGWEKATAPLRIAKGRRAG